MNLLMEPPKKQPVHIPVLCQEVVAQFEPFEHAAEALVVDATLGLGGHSLALLERYPRLSILGVEWDAEALRCARARLESRFAGRFQALEGSCAELPELLRRQGMTAVSGVLVDLGVSSLQLDDPLRGFSFSKRGPLDMRMSLSLPESAWDLLHRLDVEDLAHLFKTYGEEPSARVVAVTLKDALAQGRLTNDSWSVAQCIRAALPVRRAASHIDPATRCFQALRMAVNQELDNIKRFLDNLPAVLAPQGRAVVLAFHSLEDRIVKQAFLQAAKGCVCPSQIPQCICGKMPWATLPSRKAIQASAGEKHSNPRSRSVRMRVLEKL
jgi:16S rRNA (cytosine1402-N4)-methyltransferase